MSFLLFRRPVGPLRTSGAGDGTGSDPDRRSQNPDRIGRLTDPDSGGSNPPTPAQDPNQSRGGKAVMASRIGCAPAGVVLFSGVSNRKNADVRDFFIWS